MPPLLCPSPDILDQSFPRDDVYLEVVGRALGNLQLAVETNETIVLLTSTLQLFVEDFDWQRSGPYPLLRDIHSLLNQWFLQPHSGLLVVDVDNIEVQQPHPLPRDCANEGNVQLWAVEAARLLKLHDACCDGERFFIGIACPNAFAGYQLGSYGESSDGIRKFPLAGPIELGQLDDAFIWEIDPNLHHQLVSFDSARKNVPLLGGKVINPPGGSHYKVVFPGASRSWPLDYNEDPLKDDFVKQLVAITHYPFEVIKTVLLTGLFPNKSLRLDRGKVI